MNPRETEQLIQDAFDGELDESRQAALLDLMRRSPETLDQYCHHALLESGLRRHAAGLRKIPGTVPSVVRLEENRRHRRHVTVSILSAAAVVLLCGIILRLVWVKHYSPLADLRMSPGSLLASADGRAIGETTVSPDTPLVLSQGVLRLDIRSGVEAVIEGPAAFVLRNGNRLDLATGHAWFRVAPQARGFRVVSPTMEVTDLGTEFGLDLREDQEPQVHVITGKVEARALGGSRRKLLLSTGRAARLKPNGRWDEYPADDRKFRKNLPRQLPELHLDFDRIDNGSLETKGEILGAADAETKVLGPARLVPGISGSALDFDGSATHVESSWPGISGAAPRTISLWCRIPRGTRFQTAPPLVWWGDPALGWNRKFKIALFTKSGGQTVLRTSFGDYLSDGSTDLADGEWHHLAVVYRSNDPLGAPLLRFYVDGRDETLKSANGGHAVIETAISGDRSGTMGIGRYELAASGRNPFLKATIDELRVIAGALDGEEILRLSRRP